MYTTGLVHIEAPRVTSSNMANHPQDSRVPVDKTREIVDKFVRRLERPRSCHVCHIPWDTESDVWRVSHYLHKHLARPDYPCKYKCDFRTRSMTSLRIHMRGHGVPLHKMHSKTW